ncbi:Na+/H+ antiporter subunit E [Aurantimonas sp. Leaf443]|uniref:Na+/H+ antiporter subunit E n=1 Tax=Aurantimonas sp. Leaf443 TaxID=1736378 RepID=UPI0006F2F6CF|nr:Na+/H+ antiporter subunit E [Aurantimonas sp. Leaf443]KQT85981.1 cation:proton antiporter [Aurantimonas sp. Leaf443]
MRLTLVNLIFALVFATVTGSFTLLNILFGFVLGAGALWLIRAEVGSTAYGLRVWRVLALFLLFLKELALSAWTVARIVTKRDMDLKPGIFAFPLTVDREFEITLLANMITLTPGTLSVDVSPDGKVLYVHALDCSNPAQTRFDIAQGFERKIMAAFR